MNFLKIIAVIISFGFIASCQSLSCENLNQNFESYEVALEIIKLTDFKLNEECNTNKSSWILGAEYFSCDEQKGYLLISTKKKTYIHKDVPTNLWYEFKKAESFGKFYNRKIKRKYMLII